MTDNVGYTPGTGETIATDEIAGAHHQRVKITLGNDGVDNGTLSATNPLPVTAYNAIPVQTVNGYSLKTLADRTDNLLVMLSRVVKLLESNAVVDSAQRQRIAVDSFIATIPTVTTVATVTSITNVASNAGMDREQYINIAKQTYSQSIRNRLTFDTVAASGGGGGGLIE
jgi:hypothetical protein